jgi:hypothetical protein
VLHVANVPEGERVVRHVSAFLSHPERRQADRRRLERRGRLVTVHPERRVFRDRRSAVPRRETARAHLLNAAQILMLASTDPIATEVNVHAALRRVWLALREMDLGNCGGGRASGGRERG